MKPTGDVFTLGSFQQEPVGPGPSPGLIKFQEILPRNATLFTMGCSEVGSWTWRGSWWEVRREDSRVTAIGEHARGTHEKGKMERDRGRDNKADKRKSRERLGQKGKGRGRLPWRRECTIHSPGREFWL